MKCKSCQENISTKFAHAIKCNTCPFCGKEIIDTELQIILSNLKETMDNSAKYMSQIEDWLMANYSLKKFDLNEEVKIENSERSFRSGKGNIVKRSDGDDISDVEETTVFAKRSGANFKSMVDKIKGQTITLNDVVEDEVEMEETGSFDNSDKSAMSNLFEEPPVPQELELQKLKRLRSQAQGEGKFRRSE